MNESVCAVLLLYSNAVLCCTQLEKLWLLSYENTVFFKLRNNLLLLTGGIKQKYNKHQHLPLIKSLRRKFHLLRVSPRKWVP